MSNFNSHLGIQPGDEPNTIVLETRPEHQIVPGMIHFAVLTTLCEVSAAHATGASVVPASVTVNLLSPAKPGRLTARGTLIRKGRRLAVAEGEVFQGDKRVAKAVVTFAVMS